MISVAELPLLDALQREKMNPKLSGTVPTPRYQLLAYQVKCFYVGPVLPTFK